MKRNLNEKETKVNNILMAWNPLKVNLNNLDTEYVEYIPEILQKAEGNQDLTLHLIKFVTEFLGLEINPNYENKLYGDIEKVRNEILLIINENHS